jgi:hypothetical protein
MAGNIVAGLLSGLIVTLFIIVFGALWRNVLTPWFEDRVYKDIRIEGSWLSLYPTVVGNRQELVSLERHGHYVKGYVICTVGLDQGEKYKIAGSFRNLILTLSYESDHSEKVDRGTMTLRCVKNGRRLAGVIANYNDNSDSIQSSPIIWFRKEEDRDEVLSSIRRKDPAIAAVREKSKEVQKEIQRITADKIEDTAAKAQDDEEDA